MNQGNDLEYYDYVRMQFFKNAWRVAAGRKPIEYLAVPDTTLLRVSEWSQTFETLMRNRLILGAIRYGRLGSEGKPKYDRITRAAQELELYRKDRNAEHLVDVANMMLLEFEEGDNVFKPLDGGLHNEPR